MTTTKTRTAERRRAAIQLLKGNNSQLEVARLLGVSRESVRKWWNAYQDGGAKALAPSKSRRGPAPRASDEELRKLAAEAKKAKAETLADVLRMSRSVLGKRVSRTALRRRLMSLGLWP